MRKDRITIKIKASTELVKKPDLTCKELLAVSYRSFIFVIEFSLLKCSFIFLEATYQLGDVFSNDVWLFFFILEEDRGNQHGLL